MPFLFQFPLIFTNLTRVSMHSWCPLEDAQCKAVNPSLSMHVTEAPALTKVMIASVLPVIISVRIIRNVPEFCFFNKMLDPLLKPNLIQNESLLFAREGQNLVSFVICLPFASTRFFTSYVPRG